MAMTSNSNSVQPASSQEEKIKSPRRGYGRARTPSSRLVSSAAAPLVPFQCYKLPQRVVDALERYARAQGWSRGAAARKVLTDWAAKQGKKGKQQEL